MPSSLISRSAASLALLCFGYLILLVSVVQPAAAASAQTEVRQFDASTGKWVKKHVDNRQLARKLNVAPVPPQIVPYEGRARPGTIIVDTGQRRLLYVNRDGTATSYIIGVGREGFSWKGSEKISRKAEWPSWTPPEEMRQREAANGRILPVSMEGGPDNPLGARALYLGGTLYRIHGTNEPWTLGKAVSSGCIRMANEDIIELYNKANIGSVVIVQ
ncbi:MAG: L,D-transpeptidase [Mesorhizobium sp.]|nr:L,D-transpeptidase [Mesorhizobium sp.]